MFGPMTRTIPFKAANAALPFKACIESLRQGRANGNAATAKERPATVTGADSGESSPWFTNELI